MDSVSGNRVGEHARDLLSARFLLGGALVAFDLQQSCLRWQHCEHCCKQAGFHIQSLRCATTAILSGALRHSLPPRFLFGTVAILILMQSATRSRACSTMLIPGSRAGFESLKLQTVQTSKPTMQNSRHRPTRALLCSMSVELQPEGPSLKCSTGAAASHADQLSFYSFAITRGTSADFQRFRPYICRQRWGKICRK